jgi:protein-S-isoprenylcysteine O-methyltransferase Ste14
MPEHRAWWLPGGSLLWLVLAPGIVAGWVPFWLTSWRLEPPFFGAAVLRVLGGAVVAAGLAALVECFWRFAAVGLGTPAPVAPPTRLVVSGQYSHVRNPMYVAIVAALIGQGLLLGSAVLLRYAALIWLIFHVWVLLYEEPRLASRFGASYDAYRKNVRRWWPRLRPWRG